MEYLFIFQEKRISSYNEVFRGKFKHFVTKTSNMMTSQSLEQNCWNVLSISKDVLQNLDISIAL